ncbi:Zinc/iron permease [Gorgonomyces haynaldii]|nr:Zinc/iron permease [Gorgonomyces haynaldii]
MSEPSTVPIVDSPAASAEPIDECAAFGVEGYNLNLQIAGVFILFGVSLLGTLIPLLAKRLVKKSTNLIAVFKMFGAGALLAVALIHMLIPAVEMLNNKCLPAEFTSYSAWAGALALFALLSANLMQIFLQRASRNAKDHSEKDNCHVLPLTLEDKRKRLDAYLLEGAVFVHSVIIGVAIGTTGGDEYVPLVIALAFHQFVEGLAISSLIAEAFFHEKYKAGFMAMLYTIATPIGAVIGILVHENANMNNVASLLLQGILESLAAGLLIYDAIASIIVPFYSSEQFTNSSLGFQFLCISAKWLGALILAIIGYWA